MENFRKELHRSLNIRLSEGALQMYSIEHTNNRVIVQWIFPEELTGKIFHAEYLGLMAHHEVDKLRIEEISVHSVSTGTLISCFIAIF